MAKYYTNILLALIFLILVLWSFLTFRETQAVNSLNQNITMSSATSLKEEKLIDKDVNNVDSDVSNADSDIQLVDQDIQDLPH